MEAPIEIPETVWWNSPRTAPVTPERRFIQVGVEDLPEGYSLSNISGILLMEPKDCEWETIKITNLTFCKLEEKFFSRHSLFYVIVKNNKVYFLQLLIEGERVKSGNFPEIEFQKELDIFQKMLSTFRFIEEIKTGKVKIDYEEIKRIQQSVDEGHQPWRLDPMMVVISEAQQYGFTEEDIKTIYMPHIDPRWVLGKDITGLPVEIIHNGKKYEIMVIQPIPGEDKIWTISEIKLKE